MSLLSNLTTSWSSPMVLVDDEVWQAREGSCYLSTDETPSTDDGIVLEQGQALFFSAGMAVHYRSKGLQNAILARVKV
ncbi:hypothetical protein SAMN05444003_2361 [Cognatiyoonia sediminum]|uniref:Uncharacterized protein n=1 Tax=Cognatiyoonia sediminum TaxID=1508389 RepID=A0A1M5QX22_9RHOB|nr:hypothetical protein [Cognatiyoonia sediminum]SHH18436.1 hypothetical protein SAMN05444003_2361 [Cognatiyoonia sediminum]